MTTESTNGTPPNPCSFSIRLPRPLSIGLATVILVVIAVGLQFGIPIYRRHLAIREIERVGGRLWISQSGPPWLRSVIGDEAMKPIDDVKGVYLDGTEFGDAGMAHLGVLDRVEEVCLRGTRCTDAGLKHIARLKCLVRIDLGATRVTDVGVAQLQGALPQLEISR